MKTIVISYFDPFAGAEINNSEKVALLLKEKLKESQPFTRLLLCPLPTIFDQAADLLGDLLKKLNEPPLFVISLGEGGNDLRLETMSHNLDHNPTHADNKKQTRSLQKIIPSGPLSLGMTIDLVKAYSSLTKEQRETIKISISPGQYVCNNTAYLFAYHHPKISYGFIHVPNHRCENNEDKVLKSVEIIEKILTSLMQSKNRKPLSTNYDEVLKLSLKCKNSIEKEFYSKWVQAYTSGGSISTLDKP